MDNTMTDSRAPIDVWLRFSDEYDEDMAEYEANTFIEDDQFRVEWYHNDVGQVTELFFDTYVECELWYRDNGYEDYTA